MKKKVFLITAIILLLGFAIGYQSPHEEKAKAISYDASCVIEERRTIRGVSMQRTFENGEVVNTLANYFDCNKPESGQIVIIEFATREESFIKRLVAIPGDMIEFKEGYAELNGEVLKNPAGEVYKFFERSHRILANETRYLVLSDDAGENAFDSRRYGFIDRDHFKGLVLKTH